MNYHRVLNRAAWSQRARSQVVLGLLIAAFAPDYPVVLGVDDTIARRRGARIAAKGIYRDPVRSSHGHLVKASGLRWLGLMLLVPIPWAERIWALPFLTALACAWMPPSTPRHPRPAREVGRPRAKDERLPNRSEVLADPGTSWRRTTVPGWYGEGERIIELCSGTAMWRHAGPPVVPIRWALVRDPLGRFTLQALLCTDAAQTPEQMLHWFVQRWHREVTFQEARAHLGAETQRQWSDLAIARTTPYLLALFSLVTLLATRLSPKARGAVMEAAWYRKPRPTFSDTLAAVRRHIWQEQRFVTSHCAGDMQKL